MNWEAISAIGQVLGALGVIASLLYLAAQVHRNSRASAVAAKLASTQLLNEFVDSFITDPAPMDLWLCGAQGSRRADRPGATGVAVIVLRRKRPAWPRPYRTWGCPWTPIVFVSPRSPS